jgi:hypothetical protein
VAGKSGKNGNLKPMEDDMQTIPRNVILDLLPVYIAGEASKESRALIEEFAQNDPQIARLIKSRNLEPGSIPADISPPEDLEMKTMKRIRSSIRRQMWYVSLATASILLVPLVAMQFTNEVNWTVFDFIVMGILLLGSGLTFLFISKMSDRILYRTAVGLGVAAGFLLIWVNLAAGIIGSADNPANLMYIGVLAVGIIGAFITRFQPRGMSHALFLMALTQLIITVVVLIADSDYSDSGSMIFVLSNAFFMAMWIGSALLFRYSAREQAVK